MQKLINPTQIATKPELFTPYQIRTVDRLAKTVKLVSIPETDFQRLEKGPLSVLFYDADNKLNLWRIGQHNVLSKKVTR